MDHGWLEHGSSLLSRSLILPLISALDIESELIHWAAKREEAMDVSIKDAK